MLIQQDKEYLNSEERKATWIWKILEGKRSLYCSLENELP